MSSSSTPGAFWHMHVAHLAHRPSPAEDPRLVVSRGVYRGLWGLLVVLQLVILAGLLFFVELYVFLAHPTTEYTRTLLELPSASELRAIAGVFGLCALTYAWNVTRVFRASIRHRRLTLPLGPLYVLGPRPTPAAIPTSSSTTTTTMSRRTAPTLRWYARLVLASVFSRRGLFGVDHPSFDLLLVAREVLELTSQTYQVYNASLQQPSEGKMALMVGLLCLNCWSTPCIAWGLARRHLGDHGSVAAQRMWCLLVDALLDMAWAIGVGLYIAIPHFLAYDPRSRKPPFEIYGDHAKMLTWQMEVRYTVVTSLGDLISTVLPLLSIFVASRGVAALVQCRDDHRQENGKTPSATSTTSRSIGVSMTPDAMAPVNTASRVLVRVAPTPTPPALPPPHDLGIVPTSPIKRIHGASRTTMTTTTTRTVSYRRAHTGAVVTAARVERLGNRIFVLWGVVVLALHLQAQLQPRSGAEAVGCRLWIRPWGMRMAQCTYANLNCLRIPAPPRTTTPSADVEPTDHDRLVLAMDALDSTYLQSVVISHCADLAVPSALHRLPELRALEIYNSTLTAWPEEAAISAKSHPQLLRLGLIEVNVSGLPASLCHECSAQVLSLVATNLTTLPETMDGAWTHLRYMTLEHNPGLEILPSVLSTTTRLQRLALTGNRLRHLPTIASSVRVFMIQSNPLNELPELADPTMLTWLGFDDTNISTLPPWLIDNAAHLKQRDLAVHAHGTPYCEQALTTNDDGPVLVGPLEIDCALPDPRLDGYYPLVPVRKFLQP